MEMDAATKDDMRQLEKFMDAKFETVSVRINNLEKLMGNNIISNRWLIGILLSALTVFAAFIKYYPVGV
jgi:hypothetical protein